jgi:ABC-type transport system involved in multi-copper enzyme maturation permease subunit
MATSRPHSSSFFTSEVTEARGPVGWLLIKDLQILRRSPLLLVLLIVYPVTVALLIGFSFSRGPDRPKVAIADESLPGDHLEIGGRRLNLLTPGSDLYRSLDLIKVQTRADAIAKVKNGEALGAVIIPQDMIPRLEGGILASKAHLDVYVDEEDPLKARLVEDAFKSLLANANFQISYELSRSSLKYLNTVLNGGRVNIADQNFDILGLKKTERIAKAAKSRLPAGSREGQDLDRVITFTQLAQQGLNLTPNILGQVSQPIALSLDPLSQGSVPLTTFAAAVAVALSLAFVAVLLAAGSLALERSENTFERLVRGPLTRTRLLAEKIALAAGCSALVTLAMLLVLSLFIPLEWGRVGLWLIGLIVAATAFGAMGAAIGALAREVSVASLLAFALLLPVAFLALVPSGVVSTALYDVARAVSAVFPFRPTVKLMSSALYEEGDFAGPLLHLLALVAGFGALSRLALRRFS